MHHLITDLSYADDFFFLPPTINAVSYEWDYFFKSAEYFLRTKRFFLSYKVVSPY